MTSAAQAQRLLREGRVDEAGRVLLAILDADPQHGEALNFAGLIALQQGQLQRAAELLERARAVQPADPTTLHHLGFAREAQGDLAGALEVQSAAVRLQPAFHVGRLHVARLLALTGQPELAAVQYARCLEGAQAAGQWLNSGTTPEPLRAVVEQAVAHVRSWRRAGFDRVFAPLLQQHGRDALERVERCLRIYFGEEVPSYPDPLQRPNFLYFPGLPTSAFFDTAQLPWVAGLEAQTDAIRGELRALLPSASGRERVFASEALESENLVGGDIAPTWNGYYFYRHGERREENCRRCPATIAALDALPLARIREHAPETLYSVFTPGTHLMPHRGVTNTRLVCHLPLIVPEDCALRVGTEVHAWQEGRVVVFDDTYEHEAWNRSGRTRVVLIFDIWNPHLTQAEQAALTHVVESLGDFRKLVEAA
jgi:aspartate beta-hydroxylase